MRLVPTLAVATAVACVGWQPASAAFYSLPRALKQQVERLATGGPVLAPLAHTRFCLRYPDDCKVGSMLFRGGPVRLTGERRADLEGVNRAVNRSIKPERAHESVAFEQWLIAPPAGDCNDYAVTKRHELLKHGWPARALLLAEVVTSWGEHHLVLVVRTDQGDLVADNLTPTIRPWVKTGYRWVRVQSPGNPRYWAAIARARA